MLWVGNRLEKEPTKKAPGKISQELFCCVWNQKPVTVFDVAAFAASLATLLSVPVAESVALEPVELVPVEPDAELPVAELPFVPLLLPVFAGGAMLIVVLLEPEGELDALGAGTVRLMVRLIVVLWRSTRVTVLPGTTIVLGVGVAAGATTTGFVAGAGA